jgi:hypothetical protein
VYPSVAAALISAIFAAGRRRGAPWSAVTSGLELEERHHSSSRG